MLGITQHHYDEAMDASSAMSEAADLIRAAAKMLDGVPFRFMDDLNEINDVDSAAERSE